MTTSQLSQGEAPLQLLGEELLRLLASFEGPPPPAPLAVRASIKQLARLSIELGLGGVLSSHFIHLCIALEDIALALEGRGWGSEDYLLATLGRALDELSLTGRLTWEDGDGPRQYTVAHLRARSLHLQTVGERVAELLPILHGWLQGTTEEQAEALRSFQVLIKWREAQGEAAEVKAEVHRLLERRGSRLQAAG